MALYSVLEINNALIFFYLFMPITLIIPFLKQ